MRTIRFVTLMLLAMLLLQPAYARKKPAYKITLKIDGGRDSLMYLGSYYARGNTVIDTASLNKKGCFEFEGDDTLKPGLYFFANQKGSYVEFVVYHEKPYFTFETKQSDWTVNMEVKGSRQNQFFFDFHRMEAQYTDVLNEESVKMDSASFAALRAKQLMALDSVKRGLMDGNPDMFLSKMMKATLDIDVPYLNEQGDSLTEVQRRDYFFDHYFDNMPVEDNAIVRTPKMVFFDRVMRFFDTYLKYAPPEVIIRYLDPLLERAKAAPDVFQYLVVHFTQKYLQSNVSVYDAIYVHMVQKYYASDDNFWSTPTAIQSETVRAAKWERLLVGEVAPQLILYDTLRVPHSLHDMPHKWKLLVFWSPNCGHCQHVIPTVYKTFEKYQAEYDLGAFTILSDPDDKTRGEWKQFLKEHDMTHPAWLSLDGGEANVDWHDVYDIQSTPQIYLLDENNIIVAKKLGESHIEEVLQTYCGSQNGK